MSTLRVNCPRCHATLTISRHQEQSGQLGCPHCGQLMRLAPRPIAPAMAMAAPMIAPAFAGGYWQNSPHRRARANGNPWLAIALASVAMFLTVLTICITILITQSDLGSGVRSNGLNQGQQQLAQNDQSNPFKADNQPVQPDVAPQKQAEVESPREEPKKEDELPPDVKPSAPADASPLGNRDNLAKNDNAENEKPKRNNPVPALPGNVTQPTATPPTIEPAPEPERKRAYPNPKPIG